MVSRCVAQPWRAVAVALLAAFAVAAFGAERASAGVFTGKVVEVRSKLPLAGATVTLQRFDGIQFVDAPLTYIQFASNDLSAPNGPPSHQISTVATGRFIWTVATNDLYRIRAQKPGCVDPQLPTRPFVLYGPLRPSADNIVLELACGEGDDCVDDPPLVTEPGAPVGTVPPTLSLILSAPAPFGMFIPGLDRTYDATTSGLVRTTAACTTLTVADRSSFATGHLVNGRFWLAAPLQVAVGAASSPGAALAPIPGSGDPLLLRTWTAPTVEPITVAYRQLIGAAEVLRTGNYTKSLTFTLVAGP